MSDFDFFGNTESAESVGTDPVKDFLAREQDQLAELGVDTSGFAFPSESFLPASTEGAVSKGLVETNDFDPFGESAFTPSAVTETNVTETEINAKETSAWETTDQTSDRYSALMEDSRPRKQTDKIIQWQQEQTQKLLVKDADAEKRKLEWLRLAKQELEEYYKHREEQLEKSKLVNRETEEAFVKERDEKKPGGEWERVCRQCDFNPKGTSRATRDVSRMRSLLLQLKQTPNATFVA